VVREHRWHDELHPDNAGFKAVAALFDRAISDQPGLEHAAAAPLAALETAALPVPAPSLAEQAQQLLATYTEPIVLREIGRRKALADVRDPAAGDAVMVYRTSSEEFSPEQLDVGRSLADDAERVARDTLGDTGTGDAATVAQALTGFAELPPTGTAMLAAVIATRSGARTQQAVDTATQ
jgi:hypothetical protein